MDFWAEGSQWSFIALSYKVWHFWHYLMRKSNCISQRLRLNSYHFKPMPWAYCIRFPHYFQPCRLYQELLLVLYNHKMKVVTFYKGQVFLLGAGRLHSTARVDRQCPIPSLVAPSCFVHSFGTALPFGSKTHLDSSVSLDDAAISLLTLHQLLPLPNTVQSNCRVFGSKSWGLHIPVREEHSEHEMKKKRTGSTILI